MNTASLKISAPKQVWTSSAAFRAGAPADAFQVSITQIEVSKAGRELELVVWLGESTDRARVLRAARKELKRLQAQG